MKPISVQSLSKNFGEVRCLRDLSLEVAEGSVCGLLGRNGAGKTTLMNMLVALMRPTAGEVKVLGRDPVSQAETLREVGFVSDGALLPGWLRVFELMRMESGARARWDGEQMEATLVRHGVSRTSRLETLSLGQRRLVELQLALASQPRVLLLDEPFQGMDPLVRDEMMAQLMAHAAEPGRATLITSHVLSDLERLCDRIAVLSRGAIVLDASVETLKTQVVVVEGPAWEELPEAPGCRLVGQRKQGERQTGVLLCEGALPDGGGQFEVRRVPLPELAVELLACLEHSHGA